MKFNLNNGNTNLMILNKIMISKLNNGTINTQNLKNKFNP